MVEKSLYQEYRATHSDRFRVGRRLTPVTDHLGRIRNHPCFGCIVDTAMKDTCRKCRNEKDSDTPRQSTLKF
jgi:hypothetical protein